jgi:hypothetical protein
MSLAAVADTLHPQSMAIMHQVKSAIADVRAILSSEHERRTLHTALVARPSPLLGGEASQPRGGRRDGVRRCQQVPLLQGGEWHKVIGTANDEFDDGKAGCVLGFEVRAPTDACGSIQMALELTSSLRRLGRFSLDDVRIRYLKWFQRDGTDTGPVSGRVFELISPGVQPDDAVAGVHREFGGLSAGCNPAHRAAPLAMCSFIADPELPAMAVQEARLTHEHELAGDVSAAVVVLCRALIPGAAWREALELAATARQAATQAAMSLAIRPPPKSTGLLWTCCTRRSFSSIGIPRSRPWRRE